MSSSLPHPFNFKVITETAISDGFRCSNEPGGIFALPLLDLLQQFQCSVSSYPTTKLSDCGAKPRATSVAKDRSWFGDDYTPFNTVVTDMFGNSMEIVGVGSVNLPVQTSPSQTGPGSHGTLRLKTVLHAPTVLCNILGRLDKLRFTGSACEDASGCLIDPRDHSCVAYFKPLSQSPLFELQLSPFPIGPAVGLSPLNMSGYYSIHAFWSDSERRRFEAFQASRQPRTPASEPLNAAEKQWLKKHYGNEYSFLRIYGLSIYDEEDREEGRAILRALMSNDEDEEKN